jgi:membrane-associated protease RseP (regulator of RpoE activity)
MKNFFSQNRINFFLFALTILATLMAGLLLSYAFIYPSAAEDPDFILTYSHLVQWEVMKNGLLFCAAILSFLTAHEMGHYLACRKYGVDATLPYYIPVPTLFGTMGAFIKIKSPIPSRKALFDIGAAGPLAGFVLTVPWMYLGLKWSHVIPAKPSLSKFYLQDPLLTQLLVKISGLEIPAGYEISAHPVYLAAWFGAIATAINLIPVGQLDGGHIIYSVFTKQANRLYKLAFGLTFLIGAGAFIIENYPGWVLWILIVFFLMRKGHPPTLDDSINVGTGRYILAIISMFIFIITFMPVPIQIG